MDTCKRLITLLSLSSLFFTQSPFVVFAQQVTNTSVSLTVPLRDQDVPVSLSRTGGATITQEDSTLTYQISYSSLLSYSIPLTIQASWSQASVNGSLIDLADYQTGSATDAYGGASAVIDTVNKTITWTIPSLPANTTDQLVSFSLRTNSNYTGARPISFTVTAQASSNGQSVSPATFTQYYAHTQPTSSSSSSSSSNSSASTPPPHVEATPTPSLSASLFSLIEMQTISSTSAGALIVLTKPAFLTIRYGISPTNLTKIIKTADEVTNYSLQLPDLSSETPYYFTVSAKTSEETVTSDLYTFTTAKELATSFVDLSSLIITTDNEILTSSLFEKSGKILLPTAVITTNTPFEFRFSVSDSEKIKHVVALMKNAHVLGVNNFTKAVELDASTGSVEIVEIAKGVFSGRLKTQITPGSYTLFARISDENNNITEQAIAKITVVKPLTVLEAGSNKPLENIRILMYRKQPRTNQYTLLSEQSIAMKNPVYTQSDGTVTTNLIQGDYKIHVSATGYDAIDKFFTISPNNSSEYPTIYLKKREFSVINTIEYYSETTGDLVTSFSSYLSDVGISNRFFTLISLIALFLFIIVTILSFCTRFHVPVSALPAYVFSFLHLHHAKAPATLLTGVVIDKSSDGFPISNAIIYLLDKKRRRILLHTQTNKLGTFSLSLPVASSYLLIVKKRHYLSTEHTVSSFDKITITLEKDMAQTNRIFTALHLFFTNLLGLLFEVLLFLSFVLEVLFSTSFGVGTVFPFLLVSFLNLVIWLLFIKNKHLLYSN